MRVSGFRETLARPNGHKSLEPRDAAGALESASPEPVDEEIESLLASLDQLPVDPGPAVPATASQTSRRPREQRAVRRQGPRLQRADQFDLVFLLLAVVLGLAVGLLTVFLLNG
jgi:hypothetical protein